MCNEFPFLNGEVLCLMPRELAIKHPATPAQSYFDLMFGEFPEEVSESGFAGFVAVGKQGDFVIRRLTGELGYGLDLSVGRFVAAEGGGGDFEFFEAEDVVHPFDDDYAAWLAIQPIPGPPPPCHDC